MKTILLLLLLPLSVFGQIDYHFDQINKISNKDSVVTIDYIISSPKKAPLSLSLKVFFTNENFDDNIGSYVIVDLMHNNTLVRNYKLNTGDHINSNFIVLDYDNAIKLKRGDQVSLVFTLIPRTENVNYIFTIKSVLESDTETQKKIEKYAMTASVKPVPVKKEVKMKRTHQVPWIGRNIFGIREQIGTE